MRFITRALVAVAAIASSPAAYAANVITLTFDSRGTGQRITGFEQTGEPITATLQAATVKIAFTQFSDNYYEGFTGGNRVGATFSDAGLKLDGNLNAGYTIGVVGALSCYTGLASVGSYSYNDGCGSIQYLRGSSIGQSENFAGKIYNFRIDSGDTTGGAGYSIVSFVPEPSTWALMLAGFGMVGFAMRRRRAVAVVA